MSEEGRRSSAETTGAARRAETRSAAAQIRALTLRGAQAVLAGADAQLQAPDS
jgi:hypothetical protein